MAKNRLQETDPVLATFEIVGAVRGITVDDYNELSAAEEEKWLFIDFESVGAGTCVTVDFDDGIQQAFGDEYFCAEWAPDVEFLPGVSMEPPVAITHVY